MNNLIKDPDATLDFCIDWSAWLEVEEDIATFSLIPKGIEVESHPPTTNDGKKIVAWLSGGTNRTNASLTCRVETTMGRVDDRTLHIRIQDR